jgi:hypothetical protein
MLKQELASVCTKDCEAHWEVCFEEEMLILENRRRAVCAQASCMLQQGGPVSTRLQLD